MLYNNLIDRRIDLTKLGKDFTTSEYPIDDKYLPYLPVLVSILSGMYGTEHEIYNSAKLSQLLKEHFKVEEIKEKHKLTIWNPFNYGITLFIDTSKFHTDLYDISIIEIRSNIYTNFNHHPVQIKYKDNSCKEKIVINCRGPEYPVYV